MPPVSITCPLCGATSYNPNDVEFRYCGACDQFHDEMESWPERLARLAAAMDGPIDTTDIPEARGDERPVRRDAAGRLLPPDSPT